MYTALSMPPARASRSPTTARAETVTWTPVAQIAPATASTIPTHTRAGNRRPWARASRPCHTGWVATRAVAVATVVRVTLGTQVPKCAASATPASRLARAASPRLSRAATSCRRWVSAAGPRTPSAAAVGQKAMATAGAAAYAISGPEVATPSTATARTPTISGSKGRLTVDDRVTSWTAAAAGRSFGETAPLGAAQAAVLAKLQPGRARAAVLAKLRPRATRRPRFWRNCGRGAGGNERDQWGEIRLR